MSIESLFPIVQAQRALIAEPIDLNDLIYGEYELFEEAIKGRVYCGEKGYDHTFAEEPIITTDNVKLLKYDETGVQWSFETDDLGIGIEGGTITSGSKDVLFRDRYKVRHEFVAEALQKSSTDKRLREVFHEEGDEDDNVSPDFIWKDHRGFYHVVELATTRNNTIDGLERIFQEKLFKYKYALEIRAMRNKLITFSVIVVSQDHVYSSIRLSRALVTELIVRVRIGLAIENLAKSKGVSLESDALDVIHEAMVNDIQNHLKTIKPIVISSHGLTITQQYIQDLKRDSNEKEVMEIYLNEIYKIKSKAFEERANPSQTENLMSSYIEEFSQGDRKSNPKSPINLPLFLSAKTESSTDVPDLLLTPISNVLETKLWCIAMDNYRTERTRNIDEDPAALIREAMETDIDAIKFYEAGRKSTRSKYHRVNIIQDLNQHEKELAAEQGLWAKKYKNDIFYKERRKQSQKSFSWDTFTDDISTFIERNDLLDKVSQTTTSQEMTASLLKHSEQLIGNSDKGLNCIRDWMGTKIFQGMDLISDIAMELAISNKQNCKSGSAILKKLRYHDAFILIFPTKSSEHTFFTLYFPRGEPLARLPFRDFIKTQDGYIYPLVSVKQSKLENWVTASSFLMTQVAFWSWFYELEDDSVSEFKKSSECTKMLLYSILVRLEDKAETEMTITQMRYMYMESFKGMVTPILSNPFKILSKLTTIPRSRLNLWTIKTCLNNFKTMSLFPPQRIPTPDVKLIEGEDSLPKDIWSGLLNCFTGASIINAGRAINLSYLGYMKNKNESAEGNTDFTLIEKTMEEEFKLDETDLSKSMGEVKLGDKIKSKQFSSNCIIHGCEIMEKRLRTSLGEDWKSQLGVQILDKLADAMTEEIATLKASCSIKHESYPKHSSINDPIASMRIKVLEAIASQIKNFGLNPFTKLDSFITFIETTSKGVIADLFKKQQHGGLREIYVLTIESRVVQLFIETISRTICSYFEEETLTHPKNKLRKLNEHRRLSARVANKRTSLSVDLCSSNDKTRWNQNFVMPAMIIPLIRLTPDYMHNAIMRIMNLWSNKLIRIPQSVCLHLLHRTPFKSETYKKLNSLFWQLDGENDTFDFQTSNCVRLRTGFMQGILHYTSSLVHLTFLNSSTRIIPLILKNWFPDNGFIMTQICSSDDSASMLSVFSPTNNVMLDNIFIKVCSIASLCLESMSQICNYYCLSESVKSTIALLDYVEFNSEFMCNNNIIMPVVKFVIASLGITESESFIERFYTLYNLLSDLFASGFSAEHTHICQLAQGMLHYKTMGSSTNALFQEWHDYIREWPDPKYGFFLTDLDILPGVLGYAYSHWNACVKTSIFQGTVKELNSEPWVVTQDGGITQSLIIKHGEVLRWRKLVKNVVGDLDLQSSIEKDPSLLFRPPENLDELSLKLCISATSPGVAKSMRRGNPFLQSVAMSVYAINTHSFSKTTVTYDMIKGKKEKGFQKVCLLGELVRLIATNPVPDRDVENSLLVAFPNKAKYEEITILINKMRKSRLVECHRFRERKNEVVIQPRTASLPLSLLQVVKSRWFGFPVRASIKIVNKCWISYTGVVPWLRNSIEETLLESPFSTYQELHGFISSTIQKSRTFRRNGPGIYSKRLIGQIYNLVRKSQRPCRLLVEEEGKRRHLAISSDLITEVSLGLSIPIFHYRDKCVRNILLNSEPIYEDLGSIANLTRREATLAYIQGVLKGDFSLSDVAVHMRDLGLGTHVSYVKEQRRLETPEGIKWEGEGLCYIFVEGCQVQMTIKDEYITLLKIDNWKRLKSNIYNFNQLIRDMKLKPILDSSMPRTVVAKYNGTHFVSKSCVGCPILNLDERSMIKFDPAGLSLRVALNEIKLVQKVYSSFRNVKLYEICMLKYRVSHNDILLPPRRSGGKELWQSWINQSSCEDSVLFSVIKRAIRDKKSSLFRWLRETLQARLQFLSLGSFGVRYYDATVDYEDIQVSSKEEEEEEEILNMIRSGKLDIEESKFIAKIVKPGNGKVQLWVDNTEKEAMEEELQAINTLMSIGVEDAIPIWTSYVKNWKEMTGEESVSVLGPGYGSFLSVHPLWDELIENIKKECNHFWLSLADGKVPAGYDDMAKDLMILLDIKEALPSQRELSISEKYRIAGELSIEVIEESEELSEEITEEDLEQGFTLGGRDSFSNLEHDVSLESERTIIQKKEESSEEEEDIYSIFD